MGTWEIIIFILIIVALVALIWLLNRSEKKTKNKWKLTAYRLLEEEKPDPKKIKETVKFVRIYGGRFSKDPEFAQLDNLLCDLYRDVAKNDIDDTKHAKSKK